jgi:hypothetical protein
VLWTSVALPAVGVTSLNALSFQEPYGWVIACCCRTGSFSGFLATTDAQTFTQVCHLLFFTVFVFLILLLKVPVEGTTLVASNFSGIAFAAADETSATDAVALAFASDPLAVTQSKFAVVLLFKLLFAGFLGHQRAQSEHHSDRTAFLLLCSLCCLRFRYQC